MTLDEGIKVQEQSINLRKLNVIELRTLSSNNCF